MNLVFDFTATHPLMSAIALRTANLCIPQTRYMSYKDDGYIFIVSIRAEAQLPIIHILVEPKDPSRFPFEEIELDIQGNFQFDVLGNVHSSFSNTCYNASNTVVGNVSLFTDVYIKTTETIWVESFLNKLHSIFSDSHTLELDPDTKGYTLLDPSKKESLVLEPEVMGYTYNAVEIHESKLKRIPAGTIIH